MTTRQELRPNHRIRARARRAITAPLAAALAAGLVVTAGAVPVQAAPPAVAGTWSALMYRSLTRPQTATTLRTTIATQQATVVTRTGEIAKATTRNTAAQTGLTTATTAVTAARARQTYALTSLATAKTALTTAQAAQKKAKTAKKRTAAAAATTKAKNVVAAATRTLTARQTQTREAVTALTTAQVETRTAAALLVNATAARESAAAAVRATQQRLALLPPAETLAGQASVLSKDVVAQARTGFAVTDTTTVYGTTVHKNVAYAFKRMVDDAKRSGIVLSGGGFRTKQRQIELRKINGCPDVWLAPSSSCRVPTAIPGRSLHELGMAIDISSGGKTLTRSSPAFKWLSVNAKKYGFVNLPSEAWHWSITGG
ncbi:M15 family metallopeptidase [Actinoplanes solisilvae]|uniref:M15 family metallopeptidase n=1 Tax=Actinoplanes solisilvae TaxID=2486853 RepID=UPI001F0BD00F|nr:M15 family metallopeptidase [Actinoplanes solisilvae]